MPRLGGLWHNPDFVKLWAGESISVFGSLIGGTGLRFTAILTVGATPIQMALLATADRLPGFLAGLIAGVWVDRLQCRPIMIATDIGRALLLLSIPAAWWAGVLHIEQLYAVAFGTGILTVFFDVAYQSYLPSIVERDELVEGNSKLTGSASVAEFSGFSIAGWLVQLFGAPIAVLIDAVSFGWSALFVGAIRRPEPPPAPVEARQSVRREIRDGLSAVRQSPILRAVAITQVLRDTASGIIGAVILLYVTRDLGLEPGVQGLIFGVGGVTSLLGALIAARAGRVAGTGPTLIVALLLSGAGAVFIPLAHGGGAFAVALLVASQLVTDPAWAVYDITEVSLRQRIAPELVLGRVNASIRFAGLLGLLAGSLAGGVLGETIGLRATLYSGVGCTAAAVLWLSASPVRSLREAPPLAEPVAP